MNEFKYDVAFSFLQEDEALAIQLNDRLKRRLKTFIYSERQLEIAGTDGAESFGKVYGEEARAVVVLYRDGWGQSGWTLIEKTAMKNRAFEPGYGFVLFIPVGKKFTPPAWLPKTQLWIGIERWGIDVAAGVIEARVQELGGSPHEESAEEMASRLHHETELAEQRKKFLWSEEAVKLSTAEFGHKATSITLKCCWLRADGHAYSSTYSFGRRLLVQEYIRIVLGSEGLVKDASRMCLCDSFRCRFSEFVFDSSVLLVNPLVWERVERALPELLEQFSGAATGPAGEIHTTFCKQSDGSFVAKRSA